ncbi:MAG TPA: ABC-F family ATP-binding cassette domain-containing protein [Smithella sp.]|nr:ABC-F family ATP-binding cassette domain-containing protein [Smithella sp.]
MIYFRNVHLSFLDKKLFDNLSWTIHPQSRIGLVGENGSGKTTLFRVLMEEVHPDAGVIEISGRKNNVVGYLPQDMVELEALPLIEFLKKKSGMAAVEKSIHDLERHLSDVKQNTSGYSELSKKYSDALAHFSAMDGYAFETRAKQVLKGFAFTENDFNRPCNLFSGGWKMRILLSSILLARPDIMLLDEPTNHLDTESMEWLESYLKDYRGTIIVISHDHFFLDKIATQIAELSSCNIHIYKGNYSYYLEEKERRHAALKKEMELQRAQIKKVEEFVERFRYKATKASQVQSRIKMLERYSDIKVEGKTKSVAMKFPEGKKSSRDVVKATGLGHRYGGLNVFSHVNFTLFRGDKVAFVGVNGSGKSTLSRLLSLTEQPSCGSVQYGESVNMAFFSQESSQNLNYRNTIWEEINSVPAKASDQDKRNLLGAFLFSGDDIFKLISVLSGGEKSRLALLKIMLLDTNFLILDEPTNHLDVKTKDIFQNALMNYHGTVAIVSHDRYFLDHLVNKIFELKDGKINYYQGNYSYFIEKRRQAEVLETDAKMTRHSPEGPPVKNKEKKRLEAEERNKNYRIRAPLEKELSVVEKKIALLESKKSDYEAALCDPQTHRDAAQIKNISMKLKDINAEVERLYDNWTALHAKMEELFVAGTQNNRDQA